MRFIFLTQTCVIKISISAHLRELNDSFLFERWALIQGERLFDISMSRVGTFLRDAYLRGRLIEILQ